MSAAPLLPPGFAALAPFVADWALPTTNERLFVRASKPLAETRAFYDAMVDHADAAMTEIDRYPLDAMPEDVARLACLVLALAQASVAIEIHGAPRAPGTPWPNSIRLATGAYPLG